MEKYFSSGYDKYENKVRFTGRQQNMKNERIDRKSSYAGRIAGGLAILLLVIVIVPVGGIMFILSGLWSAFDRFLLKFNR